MKLSKTSIVLLVIQLGLVSSIASKYVYQRATCPRGWTRTAIYDPELVMRGRYLSMTLMVNGCGHMPPDDPAILLPKRFAQGTADEEIVPYPIDFNAKLGVSNDKLTATWIPGENTDGTVVQVDHSQGGRCDALRLQRPVDFYIAEHAKDITPLKRGQELWVEATVPPKGQPRPIQLALKQDGVWKPLAFQ
jgi:uncharacterized membrane-anchored protein